MSTMIPDARLPLLWTPIVIVAVAPGATGFGSTLALETEKLGAAPAGTARSAPRSRITRTDAVRDARIHTSPARGFAHGPTPGRAEPPAQERCHAVTTRTWGFPHDSAGRGASRPARSAGGFAECARGRRRGRRRHRRRCDRVIDPPGPTRSEQRAARRGGRVPAGPGAGRGVPPACRARSR